MKSLFVASMVAVMACSASAATVASWEFAGFAGNEATASGSELAGMENSVLSRGSGISALANADSFSASGFQAAGGSLASALAANNYYTFTLEASANYLFSVSSIDFNFSSSSDGPQSWALFSSVNGFADIGDALIDWGHVGFDPNAQTATLSGVTELQNISGPIEFRVYGYEASGDGGSGRLEGTGNDITVNGEVVPEPATMGLLGLGALVLALRRKM